MKHRILFILHLPPPVHGAAMVGKSIHDSKLINNSFECRYINLTTASSLEDIGKVGFKKLFFFLSLLSNIRKTVLEFKPGLVYVTPNAKGGPFYKDFVVVQLLKSLGCKVVAHYHNKGVHTRQDIWFDDKLYRVFFKNLKVILLSERLYEDVRKYVKKEDVYICPNGIPTIERPYVERKNPIPHILFLSNMIESKGVFVLLDALKILQERGVSFVCDFVGGETKEIDAQRFAEEVNRRELNRLVVYHGKKYGEAKELMFESSDIFVFPTYYDNETFGLVNLEAMAHYLPVISTTEGGIPDVVKDGENGLIAESNNSISLADCVQRLLEDPDLRKKMGENGYKKLQTHFTKLIFEQNMQKILMSNLGGGRLTICRYLGSKYDKEKESILSSSDIFVFPTCYPNECFPLVLLEAMQHALPCISTKEGAIQNIIDDGETGYVVNAQNPRHLAARILELANDKQKRLDMGVNGYRKFQNQFTLEVFEKRMCEVLEQLM